MAPTTNRPISGWHVFKNNWARDLSGAKYANGYFGIGFQVGGPPVNLTFDSNTLQFAAEEQVVRRARLDPDADARPVDLVGRRDGGRFRYSEHTLDDGVGLGERDRVGSGSTLPQRLKPLLLATVYGTAEAVP